MRLQFATLALMLMTGGVQASSFVVIAPPPGPGSSSIVFLGEPASPSIAKADDETRIVAAKPVPTTRAPVPKIALSFPLPDAPQAPRISQVSASIIAFDSPPPVTFEKVAAIKPEHNAARAKPIVIRGGIIGEGSSVASAPVALPAPKAGASKAPKASDVRIRIVAEKDSVSGASKSPKSPKPDAPKAAVAPPPAAPREMLAPQ